MPANASPLHVRDSRVADSDWHRFDTNKLVFYVNGKRVEESRVDAKMTLAIYLRDHRKFLFLFSKIYSITCF